MIENKIFSALLPLAISIADLCVRKMGEPLANRVLCKIGAHDWEALPLSNGSKMICRRCHILDDLTTHGIDGKK